MLAYCQRRLTRLSFRYAYVEFSDPSLVPNAMLMSETLFRGRLLKVSISA